MSISRPSVSTCGHGREGSRRAAGGQAPVGISSQAYMRRKQQQQQQPAATNTPMIRVHMHRAVVQFQAVMAAAKGHGHWAVVGGGHRGGTAGTHHDCAHASHALHGLVEVAQGLLVVRQGAWGHQWTGGIGLARRGACDGPWHGFELPGACGFGAGNTALKPHTRYGVRRGAGAEGGRENDAVDGGQQGGQRWVPKGPRRQRAQFST